MMDMWNWLMECYKDKLLTLEDLEKIMEDDRSAKMLFEEWSSDPMDFIYFVRDEVGPFIEYINKQEKVDNGKLK